MKSSSGTKGRGATPRRPQRAAVTFNTVRELALALPGVEEGTSYGTPAVRVKGKFLARLREDGDSLVVLVDFLERDILMELDPETFYITDHYRNYPAVLVRLSRVAADELAQLLVKAWRRSAPKRLVVAFDAGRKRDDGSANAGAPPRSPKKKSSKR